MPGGELWKQSPGLYPPPQAYNADEDRLLLNNVQNKTPKFVFIITAFSAIGGFLFGYDTGVISGAMLLLKETFNLSSLWQELIVSATIGAAIIFALIGGLLTDRAGRKITIILASFIFTAGSICLAGALSKSTLVIGRTILGCGIGLASMSIPMYIAEMSPPQLRGRLVTLNTVFVTGGQFIASVIDGFFSYDQNGWRYMLGLAAIPASIQFFAFFFLPESPRWLVSRGKDEKARAVLLRITGNLDVAEHNYRDIKNAQNLSSNRQYGVQVASPLDSGKTYPSLPSKEETSSHPGANKNPILLHSPSAPPTHMVLESHERVTRTTDHVVWKILKNSHTRKALFLGCFLQILQQLCGINTVMYYSATIIEMSGVRDKSKAIWLAAATAFVNFICTFIGLYLVEKIGRRTLTLFSLAGVIISLSLLAIGFQLGAVLSPPVTYHPKVFANNPCDSYGYCNTCVEDRSCGFCYVEDPSNRNRALNGSCLPTTRDNSTRSFMGRCANGIPSSLAKRALTTNYMTGHASLSDKENFYKVVKTKMSSKDRAHKKKSIFQRFFKRSDPRLSDSTFADDDQNLIWAYNFCPSEFYWLPISGLFLYLFFFAQGMGPMPWTINSEIYPLWARGTGNSIASACNWMTNLCVSMSFLTLTELVGKHVTFWIYTTFASVGFLVLFCLLPETKGKSLEQMETLFADDTNKPGPINPTEPASARNDATTSMNAAKS